MEPTTATPKKSNKKVLYIVGAIIILIAIIAIAANMNRAVPVAEASYTNTAFHYQLTLPPGWGIWSPSRDWDVGNRLSSTPKYQDTLVKYPSPEAFEKAEPELSKAYAANFDARAAAWTPEKSQYLILTNSSTTPAGAFGENKVNIGLAHFEPSLMDSVVATSTDFNIVQPFVTANGYKAFIRLTPLPPEDGDVAGIVNVQFDGTDLLEDGTTANGIVFMTSGHNANDLLLELANSFKGVK